MIQKKLALAFVAAGMMLVSCNDDDTQNNNTDSKLTLSIDGLENLGDDYRYEGWVIVNNNPVSTGVFSVDEMGKLSKSVFDVGKDNLSNATKFVLTIEPTDDPDPAPSNTKYLVGDFDGNSAEVHTGIVGDFSNISGQFTLATPSDAAANNEYGIWWLKPGETATAGLELPVLPEGWKYEGWVVAEGTPITTGTFTNTAGADDAAPYSGSTGTPPFPGEDFLKNAPTGLTFPLDVRGKTAVISIEPYPDNSPAPFTLKPLVGTAGQETMPALHDMNANIASFPAGTVLKTY